MLELELDVAPEVDENKLIVRHTTDPVDYMVAKPTSDGKFYICCHAHMPIDDYPPDTVFLMRPVEIMNDYYEILQNYDPFPIKKYGFQNEKIRLPSDYFYGSGRHQNFSREEVDKILASFPTYLRFQKDMDFIVEAMEA